MERSGVLDCRIYSPNGGDDVLQLLLPAALKADVLTQLHQQHGHQGIERTGELVRQRCYWPGMSSDIVSWCQECERCQFSKDTQPPVQSAWVIFCLRDQTKSWPLNLWCWSRPVQGLRKCWSLQMFSANTLLLCLLGTSGQRLWLRPW